ncbi:glycoside hydrolase family 2 protein [Paenibacillus agaridevorans]|uniref:glycoside hydrolase family 2 protein n=1 Tax=Paenibacillus agaridevorans TaxID=171404 RepID=UPI001BE48C21|nr:glycoside hydrolase family 2 TIM barrel-domain containing protein [Paenibacillus agaridevorans]
MEVDLNQQEWKLKGYYPWVPMLNRSMETGLDLLGVTDWIPATVPGGVHYDLYRTGLIEHPYEDLNSLKCEWVENRWWVYKTTFARPEEIGRKVELVCKGLDYKATIFMNGVCLGEHEGMYHPAVFDVTELAQANEELTLVIVFEHAPDEMAQIGKTSLTHTQKSRFNYKWDFSTRMVNIGIWEDILLRVHEDYSIDEVSLQTDVADNNGIIDLFVTLHDHVSESSSAMVDASMDAKVDAAEIGVEIATPDGRVVDRLRRALQPGETRFSFRLEVMNPELWYPNGHGKQPLYQVKIQIAREGNVLDERLMRTGIRKLAYMRNVNSPEDSLPYTFVINGKKIYIKGVNMTPLDLMYGNVTEEHYEWLVYQMKQAHINMVRVWGGGVIEKTRFYELCDSFGILIWQEFIQSSSGYDNIPSKHPRFLALLGQSAVHALRNRRNHVSLAVWSGGNELMSEPNRPSTYEDENLSRLKALVEQYDPTRLFLPTSASGPVEFITREKGVSHDVHGNWKYGGNPDHYDLYGESDNLFHSEFGVDGMSSVKSLRKFLSEPHLAPNSMTDSFVWRHHGEWWDTRQRDEQFFGPMKDLSQFAKCSQWIQAEGLRYIVEANRRRKFENSGSIIWQLNEPWPNVSCTCLVEYYGEAKMAYYWTRLAFAPLHASLDYRKLNYAAGEEFQARIYAHGNGGTKEAAVSAQVLNAEGEVLLERQYAGALLAENTKLMGDLSFRISADFPRLFFVRLQVLQDGTAASENVYFFSTDADRLYETAITLQGAELCIEPKDEWQSDDPTLFGGSSVLRLYRVSNQGSHAALHVHPIEISNAYWMEASDSFVTIFPGETKEVSIRCVRKQGGGFLSHDRPAGQAEMGLPAIIFEAFNHERR